MILSPLQKDILLRLSGNWFVTVDPSGIYATSLATPVSVEAIQATLGTTLAARCDLKLVVWQPVSATLVQVRVK